MWYNMAMITIRCNGKVVDLGMPDWALEALINPRGREVVYDLAGHVGVITAICEVRVCRADECKVYQTSAHGITLGTLVWSCTCPEAVYGRYRRLGYRLGVACKHALLAHVLKGPHQEQQVMTLLGLLYPSEVRNA